MQYYWNTEKDSQNLIKENLNLTPILHKQRQCNFWRPHGECMKILPKCSKRFNFYINKVNFVKTKWKESQIKIFTKFDFAYTSVIFNRNIWASSAIYIIKCCRQLMVLFRFLESVLAGSLLHFLEQVAKDVIYGYRLSNKQTDVVNSFVLEPPSHPTNTTHATVIITNRNCPISSQFKVLKKF